MEKAEHIHWNTYKLISIKTNPSALSLTFMKVSLQAPCEHTPIR